LKLQIHASTLTTLEDKIAALKKSIADLQQAASEDTKSSAGDKFDTSREMMKLEIEKNNIQLRQLNSMKQLLAKCKPDQVSEEIRLGALVRSNEGLYYFAIPLGKVSVENQSCFVLSLASPLGKALLGKKAGERIPFMKREIEVLEVY
ncbi:MAG: 3-oxoacyl-ACP synthase, partial [Bacteroidota bacterium]